MQKYRVQWLSLGDQNTRFYHNACQERIARNNINLLFIEDGEVLTDPVAISREVVDYFQQFMQSQSDNAVSTNLEELQDLLNFRCSALYASMLVAPFSAAAIFEMLRSLPNGKVPGSDGYTKEFFVAAWPILGRIFSL